MYQFGVVWIQFLLMHFHHEHQMFKMFISQFVSMLVSFCAISSLYPTDILFILFIVFILFILLQVQVDDVESVGVHECGYGDL